MDCKSTKLIEINSSCELKDNCCIWKSQYVHYFFPILYNLVPRASSLSKQNRKERIHYQYFQKRQETLGTRLHIIDDFNFRIPFWISLIFGGAGLPYFQASECAEHKNKRKFEQIKCFFTRRLMPYLWSHVRLTFYIIFHFKISPVSMPIP